MPAQYTSFGSNNDFILLLREGGSKMSQILRAYSLSIAPIGIIVISPNNSLLFEIDVRKLLWQCYFVMTVP